MSLIKLLDRASECYYAGNPIMSDEQFDYLAQLSGYSKVGSKPLYKTAKHSPRMWSLDKYYPGEGSPPLDDTYKKVNTPKIDGAAIALYYIDSQLVQALTRGDGEEGQVITDKFVGNPKMLVPTILPSNGGFTGQITGEVATLKEVYNARNVAAGALALNSVEEFNTRDLYFIAYSMSPCCDTYIQDLDQLRRWGFRTVDDEDYCSRFPQDGRVVRVLSNEAYNYLGFTSKHPKGAYAIKERAEGKVTKLLDVIWQTGKSGKVTPVAILEPIELGGATVTRATLNNPGFIMDLDLNIGDSVVVARSGEIIPQILGKAVDYFIDEDLSQ